MKPDAFTRYWIVLDEEYQLGYGVTAADERDALELLRNLRFKNREMPPVLRIEEDVDVSTLDPGHVVPNMGPPVWRGIWFPNLGAETK
jgi:hypothetical protein